jgi:hypothetical protein
VQRGRHPEGPPRLATGCVNTSHAQGLHYLTAPPPNSPYIDIIATYALSILVLMPTGELPKALTSQFVAPLLERAYASLPPAPQPSPPSEARAGECRPLSVVLNGEGGGAADSCKAALEALRALVSLFHLHHQNKVRPLPISEGAVQGKRAKPR